MRGATKQKHFDHIVSVLAEEFDWDEITRDICMARLKHNDYANGFPPWFEFICDEPIVANWRLKADRSQGRFVVRIGYYGGNPDKQPRADAINRRLTRH